MKVAYLKTKHMHGYGRWAAQPYLQWRMRFRQNLDPPIGTLCFKSSRCFWLGKGAHALVVVALLRHKNGTINAGCAVGAFTAFGMYEKTQYSQAEESSQWSDVLDNYAGADIGFQR